MGRTLMAARRALVVLIVLLTAIGLGTLLLQVLAPGGWTLPKLAMLVALGGTASWTGLGVARRRRAREGSVAPNGDRRDGAERGYAARAAAVAASAARSRQA